MTRTIEDVLADQRAIVNGAEGRALTDDEATRYEALEAEHRTVVRDAQIRARQAAYDAPNANNVVHPVGASSKPDDTLDRAFAHYLRTGRANQDITELRAQQVGTDSEGGYTVPAGFRNKLVEVRKSFGGLAAEVEEITTETGQTLEYPSVNDTANSGSITAEAAAFADGADLVFGTVNLGAFKYTSSGTGTTTPLRVSVELLQDAAFDIEGLIARALGTRIARKQAADWVNGAGTTLPFGIAHAGLTPDVEVNTDNTLAAVDLLDTEAALDPAYEANAKWCFSKDTWMKIRALDDANDRPLIFDAARSGIGGRPEKLLLGYPVVIDQAFAASTTDGAHFAVLGDLREAYVIRRVSNLVVARNPYSRMNNGQVEFVAWERADGNIQNRSAYKVLANQTT
jgi:HK97 family phage major capsid protein